MIMRPFDDINFFEIHDYMVAIRCYASVDSDESQSVLHLL